MFSCKQNYTFNWNFSLKVNKSVYIASPTYRFCKTVCNNISMKNVIKCVKSVKLLCVKLLNQLNHSHKKRKDSLETRAVYTEISVVSWNLPNILKYRGSILRNMASFEIDQVLAGAFHVIMDKIEADILQIAKKWNWK